MLCIPSKPPHSQAPTAAIKAKNTDTHARGSKKIAAEASAAAPRAVMTLVRSTHGPHGLSATPESALPLIEPVERGMQVFDPEVGPEAIGEVQLGVGKIPQ